MTETIYPLPEQNVSFEEDTITFLANEDAARFAKQFNGFVYSGGTGPVSGSLSHTVTALEAFVHGYYVAQPNTVLTYEAERRTYVYVDSIETRAPEVVASGGDGATFKLRAANLVLIECNPNSTEPTLSVDGLVLLLYADTDPTEITTIVDLRNLSPIVSSTKIIDSDLYGLVGDNLTDNTTEFQTMVDALPKGSVIQFGQGIYRFAATILISKGITIRGSGSSQFGTVLRCTSAAGNAITVTATDPVLFQNFVLDASVTRVSGHGIQLAGNALLCRVEDVTFDGHVDQLGITSGRGWVVEKCHFLNTSHGDIIVDNADVGSDCDAVIDRNVFASSNFTLTKCILILRGAGIIISKNRCITHEQGIVIVPAGPVIGVTISNNTFRDQSLTPIALSRVSGTGTVNVVSINNNLVGTAGTSGIFLGSNGAATFLNGKISDNVIIMTAANATGIHLQGDTQFLVDGNNIILPTGGTSICVNVTNLSNDANIGLNAYKGDTFVLKNGINTIIAPIIIPGAVTFDPPEIAANTQVELTVPAGAVLVGDNILLGRPPFSELPATIAFLGFGLGEAGQFKLYLHNLSGSPVNPGAGEWSGFLLRTP